MRKKRMTPEQKADKEFLEAKTLAGRISAARRHKSQSVTITRAGRPGAKVLKRDKATNKLVEWPDNDVVEISFQDRPLSYFKKICETTPGDRVLLDVTETEESVLVSQYKPLGFAKWAMHRHIDPDQHDGGHRRIALFRDGHIKDPDPIMNCFTLKEILDSLRRRIERDELLTIKQSETRQHGPKYRDEKKARRMEEFNKLAHSKQCANWTKSAVAKEASKNLKNRFRKERGYGWRQILEDSTGS